MKRFVCFVVAWVTLLLLWYCFNSLGVNQEDALEIEARLGAEYERGLVVQVSWFSSLKITTEARLSLEILGLEDLLLREIVNVSLSSSLPSTFAFTLPRGLTPDSHRFRAQVEVTGGTQSAVVTGELLLREGDAVFKSPSWSETPTAYDQLLPSIALPRRVSKVVSNVITLHWNCSNNGNWLSRNKSDWLRSRFALFTETSGNKTVQPLRPFPRCPWNVTQLLLRIPEDAVGDFRVGITFDLGNLLKNVTLFWIKIQEGTDDFDISFDPPMTDLKVVVVALARSSSSFVGEILAQSPRLSYLFEPMHFSFGKEHLCPWDRNTNKSEAARMWRSIFRCHLEHVPVFQKPHSAWLLEPLWGYDAETRAESCQGKSLVVKEVTSWILKIDWLHAILGENAKIIYLVRDPLNWVSSYLASRDANTHINLYSRWGLNNQDIYRAHLNCNLTTLHPSVELHRSLLENPKAPPHKQLAALWFIMNTMAYESYLRLPPGSVMLLRSEELMVSPMQKATEMFEFVGLPLPPGFDGWIKQHTQDTSAKTNQTYSTFRNSTQLVTVFQDRLTPQEQADIVEIAQPLMEKLGLSVSL